MARAPTPRTLPLTKRYPSVPDSDAAKKERFIKALSEVPNISMACTAAGMSRKMLQDHKRTDKAFSEACDAAWESHIDRLEQSAVEKAIDGWDEGVWWQGAEVGTKKVFSPQLMLGMLRANRREKYGEKVEVGIDPIAVVQQIKAAINAEDEAARIAAGLAPVSRQLEAGGPGPLDVEAKENPPTTEGA